MSELNDLITKLCPDGVPYKKLGEIAKIKRGRRLTRKQLSGIELPGTFPVFHGGIQPIGYYSEKNRQANTVMITNVGASAGTVLFSEKDFWSSDGCFCLLELKALNPRFAYYYVKEHEQKLKQRVRVAGIPTLDADVLKRFEVPVPPLPVQEEIVRILDSFTELEAELEAELDDRKEQYEYYRDYLLDKNALERMDGKSVETKKLEEVAEIKRGHRVVKKELSKDSNSGYPVYQNSLKPLGYHTYSNEKAGTPFVIAAGSAGEIGYSDVDYWGADDCYSIECDNNTVNGRYIYHALLFKQYLIKSQVRRASIPRLSSTVIKHLEIPVPSLATQERVVDILDRFDALTTSLTDGIPAEIAMRREQYEYCRSGA